MLKPYSLVGRAAAWLTAITFISHGVFTLTLAHMLDSLVRVSRRVGENHSGRVARSAFKQSRRRLPTHSVSHEPSRPSLLHSAAGQLPAQTREYPLALHHYAVLTASFSTISSLLTLFSKFFSSFLHSTCSLSVSYRYLALEGVYLPLGLQSQATRLLNSTVSSSGGTATRDFHPLWSAFQTT